MRSEISIRVGELGRSHPLPLWLAGRTLVVFALLALLVLGLVSFEVLSGIRIYPRLLYQKQKASLLRERLARLRREEGPVRTEVQERAELLRLLEKRFGLATLGTATQAAQWTDARILDALFPDPTGDEAWVRSMEEMGQRAVRIRQDLSVAGAAARKTVAHLDSIPSIAPSHGPLSSGFGWRFHPILAQYMMHAGQDITGPIGNPVVATADGTIVTREYSSSFGNYVVIDHGGGLQTLYAHLSAFRCELGQKVRRGEEIGLLGSTGRSTGPHVHYEIHQSQKPTDPLPWVLPTALVP